MRTLLHILVLAALAAHLSACGTKGKLKSPSQIAVEEEKKARKEAEKQKKNPAPAPAEEKAQEE